MGFFGSDNSFDNAINNLNNNKALYNGIDLPKYQQFNPQLYNTKSYTYDTIHEDPLLKSAQMSVLAKMSGLADNGLSDVDQAGYAQARNLGNQISRSGTDAALQNAQARGVGGSGLEFAMREIANQGGAQRGQDAGLQQAADSARQRALYNQAYGNALSGMRNQDFQQNAANTDIINRYNQMNTQQRNQNQHQNADLQNNAWMYNQGLQDKNYQNQLGRADRLAGFNNQQTEIGYAQDQRRRQQQGAVFGAGGAVVGGVVGGPAGAYAGSQVGQSIGGAY